jgi:uncharacterized protein YciI
VIWLITCVTKPDVDKLREQVHQAHVDYLDGKVREGVLVLSGPQLSEDGKIVTGTIFLINVSSGDEARAFSKVEPFTMAGMFASVTISRMRIRQGRWNPSAMEHALGQ